MVREANQASGLKEANFQQAQALTPSETAGSPQPLCHSKHMTEIIIEGVLFVALIATVATLF